MSRLSDQRDHEALIAAADASVTDLRALRAEMAAAEAERRYYDDQTGTWCVTPDDAFAQGAEWARSALPTREQIAEHMYSAWRSYRYGDELDRPAPNWRDHDVYDREAAAAMTDAVLALFGGQES